MTRKLPRLERADAQAAAGVAHAIVCTLAAEADAAAHARPFLAGGPVVGGVGVAGGLLGSRPPPPSRAAHPSIRRKRSTAGLGLSGSSTRSGVAGP